MSCLAHVLCLNDTVHDSRGFLNRVNYRVISNRFIPFLGVPCPVCAQGMLSPRLRSFEDIDFTQLRAEPHSRSHDPLPDTVSPRGHVSKPINFDRLSECSAKLDSKHASRGEFGTENTLSIQSAITCEGVDMWPSAKCLEYIREISRMLLKKFSKNIFFESYTHVLNCAPSSSVYNARATEAGGPRAWLSVNCHRA